MSEQVAVDRWDAVLATLRARMPEQRFGTWFRPLQPRSISEDGDSLEIEVPNPFFIDWFEEHNLSVLSQAFQDAWGWSPRVVFRVRENYRTEFQRIVDRPQSPPAPSPPSTPIHERANLNPRFSFENFVVGRSNELAHAACQAVSKEPGMVYNPLFIYGGVGLGKTHLMQAIGLAVLQNRPAARVHAVGAETFMNEMIEAIRAGITIDFRDRYRRLDLLLVDDIQFLSGRGRTEEEFFHTFNILYDANKQIVVTCDRPPTDLVRLEDRLTSRFQCGLVADIHAPDIETRIAILRQKAARDRLAVPDRVIHLLAENIRANIRELEGAMIRLSALSSLTGSPITEELAQDALRDYLKRIPSAQVDVAMIQRVVAKHSDVSVESLRGKRRTSQVALARQLAMYITKKRTGLTLVEIGKRFGNRDHSTVIYALGKIEEELRRQESLRTLLCEIEREIGEIGQGVH